MYDILSTLTLITFVILYLNERKLHLKVKNELTQIASKIALDASSKLDEQAPILNQYMDLLSYLASNPGHSIEDASLVINKLKEGVNEVQDKVNKLTLKVKDEVELIENKTHHTDLLQYLRENPGHSIEKAKEYLSGSRHSTEKV